MSGPDRAERLRAYYRTYNAGDADALAGFYAEDLVFTSAQGTIAGRAAMLDICRGMMAAFIDRMTPTRIVADGDVAIAEIENMLTARIAMPDFLGAPIAAGGMRTLLLAGVYEFAGDAIRRVTLYAR